MAVTTTTCNLEVDPISNTAARPSTALASIAMQNIKEIDCSISEINEKTLKFGYVIPAKPWIIYFETQYLVQMLHSVDLYHHAKN